MRFAFAFAFAAASLAAISHAGAAVDIVVDKTKQQMTVTVDGAVRHQWPVSTGTVRYDTPGGQYRALRMEKRHFSREWDDAPMPHSIFFSERGHAIHGSFAVRRLGQPASHGCVRLAPGHAEQLFALVKTQGLAGTSVTLTGDVALAARPARETAADAHPRPAATTSRTASRPRLAVVGERPQAVAPVPQPAVGPATRNSLRPAAIMAPDPRRVPQPQVGFARGADGRGYYVAPRGYVFVTGQRYHPAR
jgi:hypothetical protein